MKKVFYFGETVDNFKIRVLNEREARAGAGIFFFFAMISFMSAWLADNFHFMKIFVIVFIVDFGIRIFINPKYAPSLIIGRFIVRNQAPEYVGALQKKFAWSMGLALAGIMFVLVVVNNIIGPINLLICLVCLVLLFSETAFGICLGCKIYNLFYSQKVELCPGESCTIKKKEKIQKINNSQVLIVILFIFFIGAIPSFSIVKENNNLKKEIDNEHVVKQNNNFEKGITNEHINYSVPEDANDSCQVPDWAIKIGHEEKWKLHHGCK